jgi:hypothetical protein
MQVIHQKLRDTEALKDRYHEDLLVAENAAERLRSKTVIAIQSRLDAAQDEPSHGGNEEQQKKPSSPVVSGLVN